MQTPPFADDLASRNPDLLNQVREAILLPLSDAFAAELDGLGTGLFQLADAAVPPAQGEYLDAIQELRRDRESLIARFRAHLAKAWQGLEGGRPVSVERTFARGNDLVLVAEQELDVRLAVRNLAGAVQQAWRPELMRLDRYLGFIAGGLRLDIDSNPIGPEHLGAAMHAAFTGARVSVRAQLAAIALCEPGMVERVGALYSMLEARLVTLVRDLEMPAGGRRRGGIPVAGSAEAAGTEDWIARFFSRWDGARGATGAVAAGIDVHARDERELLPPELRRMLQASRRVRDRFRSALSDARTRRALSQRELLSILSLLQIEPHAGYDTIAASGALSQGLYREILTQASRLGLDPATIRLDHADEDILDLVALLFESILAESHLQPDLRPVIGQLLVPVAKVALQDPRLFARDSHPARRLLNLLADACDGNPGESAAELALLAQARAASQRVVAGFDEHQGVFLAVEAEFGAYCEQYRRRVEIAERRAAELQRAEERRVQARQRAAAELERLTRGRHLPAALHDFLARPWLQQVERLALRDAEAGLAESIALADAIVVAADPAGTGPRADAAWAQTRMPALQRCYSEAGMPADAAAAAAAALSDVLLGVARGDLAPLVAAATVPESPPAPVEAEPSPIPDEPPEAIGFDLETVEYFQTLALGSWLDFVDREGRVQPGKLAWVSPISGKRMFVNRRGARFCVATPEQLAAMVRLGRLRQHREDDAFYSAMQAVVDRLGPSVQAA
ncbi:DUF1631 family protein [Xanthomonas sp. XNM01]|uniref:DUF1631 family protein n=1 Tax=Xanthomonas sp. XNM01 TaxID=2769289 RepID=UPI0017806611|nr:DUF1631 family protein [Xanthomonas sp. XNM01]MBD9369377.1 DUF1631 domain-containing protein [Xanthomonas sp. XNM01]